MLCREDLFSVQANVCVKFNRDGECRIERQPRPFWKTPTKVNQILWCEHYRDERWYLHLGQIITDVPPVPTLRCFLTEYRTMTPAEIRQFLAMTNLTLESFDQKIDDPLWDMTWGIKYSPMSLAYDFLWFVTFRISALSQISCFFSMRMDWQSCKVRQ